MWRVNQDAIEKSIRNAKYNTNLRKRYKSSLMEIQELRDGDDPAEFSDERIKTMGAYSRKPRKSERVAFSINHKDRTIHMRGMGDHKQVYKRD